jgi:hypothetical protein
MGRRVINSFIEVRNCTLNQIENRFESIFTNEILKRPKAKSPERPYSIRRSYWCFLWQMLNLNTSCREVVRQLQATLAVHNVFGLDAENSGYVQARQRVPLKLMEQGLQESAKEAERLAPPCSFLRGHPLKVADGSTVTLDDNPANQKQYPQPKSQKPGCGFPIMRISVLFSLQSGAVLQVAKGNYYQHELRLFHSMGDMIEANDVVIYDRAAGNYVVAAGLRMKGAHLISRVEIRKIDFRNGERLANGDRLVVWKKSRKKPSYLSDEEWATYPEEITVRVIKITVRQKGFRPHKLILMTTLLDPVKYPALEIAQAYLRRWRLELCLDDLKTTLGMETLRCKSPAMVAKELLAFLIAHNLARCVMAQAAQAHNVNLYQISFKGTLDGFREFSAAMCQARTAKRRKQIWNELLRTLADDLVPERPDRIEPRAVKRRPKPYPRLNKPRHQYRDNRHQSTCKP